MSEDDPCFRAAPRLIINLSPKPPFTATYKALQSNEHQRRNNSKLRLPLHSRLSRQQSAQLNAPSLDQDPTESPNLKISDASTGVGPFFFLRSIFIPLAEPGGYLQWEEADLETLRFDKTRPECKTDCLDELFKLPAIQDHCLKPTWASRLPEILSEEGFMEIDRDTRGAPPPHLVFLLMLHEAILMLHV
ncbi:hypothetical protein SCUP515_05191 [Seiridium cupressi]